MSVHAPEASAPSTAVGADTGRYDGASMDAIQQHYDLSNDFYALWLGSSMAYSCALWDGPDDDLDTAQLRKFDYLIEGARATGARRVLDVGCGWGGLMDRLVGTHRVGHAVGLTLSDQQADWVRRHSPAAVEVHVQNWLDHTPDEPYDAIISIGAFEHFARDGLTRPARIAAYREFFARARGWLPAGARIAVQTNVKGNNVRMDRQTVRDLLFIMQRVFTESEIPDLAEVIQGSERIFDVVSVRNDPDHYARTCAEWLAGLRRHRDQALALVGEEQVADYERYLSSTVGHFERRHLGLARLVFEAI
ncbi:SAM-dependent methyltransferase [Micromonospora cathayae]|uniref:Cyclopropane-fatty-acyl-phospholipid synthase n=1 Tax=Micromonospora cathayae TaxID=3028804 RepID=A0ABY7ZH30_9ACTN|nr:cyclopropane-fatty-acyl-phospholipid synthase family protein [Micromonospora sp. HUAS 3]WDZ82297.1 cyclopropane-fatty-acyl-phospholipid synthase [Micromonospora sp. HUAS 3]